MAELTVPTVDFSTLGNLGNDWRKGQAEAARMRTLAELGQGVGPLDYNEAARKLLAAGDREGAMSLAQLGATKEQREYQRTRDTITDARQAQRDVASDKFQNASLAIQRQNADRLNASPLETATQRAQAASQYGITSGTPEFKNFVLTGKIPEGNTTVVDQTEQRKVAASKIGLDPANPAYQSYILTGKMPREDAQPLTATDKKAILEADEHVQTTRQVIDNLGRAKVLSKQAMSGPFAGKIGYAASMFGNQSGVATEDLNNLVTTNALGQLRSIFGGNPTEGERGILLDIQGSVDKPDAVRQKIFDRAIEAANKRLSFNEQRANEMRGGSFYKPQGGTSKTAPAPIKVATPDDARKLPSGTPIILPDGTPGVVP